MSRSAFNMQKFLLVVEAQDLTQEKQRVTEQGGFSSFDRAWVLLFKTAAILPLPAQVCEKFE